MRKLAPLVCALVILTATPAAAREYPLNFNISVPLTVRNLDPAAALWIACLPPSSVSAGRAGYEWKPVRVPLTNGPGGLHFEGMISVPVQTVRNAISDLQIECLVKAFKTTESIDDVMKSPYWSAPRSEMFIDSGHSTTAVSFRLP